MTSIFEGQPTKTTEEVGKIGRSSEEGGRGPNAFGEASRRGCHEKDKRLWRRHYFQWIPFSRFTAIREFGAVFTEGGRSLEGRCRSPQRGNHRHRRVENLLEQFASNWTCLLNDSKLCSGVFSAIEGGNCRDAPGLGGFGGFNANLTRVIMEVEGNDSWKDLLTCDKTRGA